MSAPERPTARAHRELAAVLRPGDLAIDATAGNGHDTVLLAERVGESGRVIAFDVQAEAIASSRDRVAAAGLTDRVTFIHGSHATLDRHASPGTVAAVVFNLGYLPGGDHTVITRSGETLLALDQALAALRSSGLLCIVCYPGHPGGDEESEAVVAWSQALAPAICQIELIRREGTLRPAPFLVLVRKSANPA
jgi:methylase of polypeptide subunit release factors